MECIKAPSIQDKELLPLTTDLGDEWQAPIIRYLQDKVEPTFKEEAWKLKYKTFHYVLTDNALYKRDHSLSLLKCLDLEKENYVLREVHKGICGNHSPSRLLSHKVLRQ